MAVPGPCRAWITTAGYTASMTQEPTRRLSAWIVSVTDVPVETNNKVRKLEEAGRKLNEKRFAGGLSDHKAGSSHLPNQNT